MPGRGCHATEFQVLIDGQVMELQCFKNPKLRLTLSPSAVANILNQGQLLVDEGKLEADPQTPMCADGGFIEYTVLNAAGKTVGVGGFEACRVLKVVLSSLNQNEEAAIDELSSFLERLSHLFGSYIFN